MSILNPAILLGLGFAAIPVILHFLLRQKPRKLIFPALRLVLERRKQSVRKLRFRHFFLMLLRVLAIVLLVLAISRPSLPPAQYTLTWAESILLLSVVAAGFGVYQFLVARFRRQAASNYQFEERRSRLRKWATAGTLAALLLFVGVPYQQRISAEMTGPPPTAVLDLPVAGIMLFDNSLSMNYLQEGRTTLDRAKTLAREHLQSLPPGSRIAVAETATDHPILFQSTLLSAQTRIEGLKAMPVSLSIEDRLREALRQHLDDREQALGEQSQVPEARRRDRFIRRIYILTDLARSAWRPAGSSALLRELEAADGINLNIIDLGREDFRNQAILEAEPSSDRIPEGGDLSVSTTAISEGEDVDQQMIELLFEAREGELIKQGQTMIDLDANLPATVQFPLLTGISGNWVQGEARLSGTDPLSFDNSRRFTVKIAEPMPVLVLAPDEQTAFPWMAALAPLEGADAYRNKFAPTFAPYGRLTDLSLSDYRAVTMINVPRLTDSGWNQLERYVDNGGGLIVVLGNADVSAAAYNRANAQSFLPATLDAWRPERDWRFSFSDRSHPLFSLFRQLEAYNAFSLMQNIITIQRFWKVDPAEGANVVARYNDDENSAAIIVRPHGRGRTIMLTTAVDLPENYREQWNNLASPLIPPWLFLAFAEQMTDHAARAAESQHSFLSGQTVALTLEESQAERTFLLREPNLKQTRRRLAPGRTSLVLEDLIEPGHYQLTDVQTREVVNAFSINVPAEESDLTRLTDADLDDRLGKDRYQVSRNLEELKDDINAADVGQEVFPILLMLGVVIFCGELLVSNRFYDEPKSGPAAVS